MNQSTWRKTRLAAVIAAMLAWGQPAGAVDWIGPTGDDFWSTGANWSTLAAPGAADSVFFGAIGSGGVNTVDRDFSIQSLFYRANSSHRTRVLSGLRLHVAAGVDVGVGAPADGASAVWSGGGTVAIGSAAAPARLWVGGNNSAAAAGPTSGSLTLQDISVGGFINDLSIGRKAFLGGVSFASNASGSLVLGSNSTLEVGTAASRALVNIGLNSQSLGAATGLLDAREGNVNIFASDFNLGYAINNTGAATGTLRWDSPHTLDATNLYVSRGMGSGSLELAPGATFIARTSFFGLAYNDSGASAGTTLASLDLRLNNPNFSTFVGSDLSIGRKAFLGGASFASNASGSLVLGSNSTLEVGTAASRALVNIGLNSQSLGAATGLLDAREGNVNIFASDFNLGYAINNTGAATGTLRWDSPHTLDATNLYVSRGMGSGSLELAPGATFIARTSFFGLAYNDSGASAGTTLASLDLRLNNPNFSTFVGSDLSIGRKAFLGGASFASNASGSLVLGSNSTLEVGTAASRALVNIGLNSQSLGAATGLLDAREGNVNIFASDFNLGYAINNTGAATGTLRWDSPHTLDATNLYVSRGMGSGSLELAPGATFIARTSFFGLAYNDSGASAGTTLASLDLRLNNPNFSTFVGSDLSIGRKAFLGGASFASNASGSLVLGSNSTLEVGTAASRALVNIGLNSQSLGAATGLLDAREGNVNIFASDFNLGYAINNTGAATGTLRWDSPHTLDATNLYVSRGMGSGSLELAPGATFIARTSFFGLAYNDSGASAGTTLASLDLRLNNPNFSTFVGSDLSIGQKAFLGGASFASNASGSLVLGSNSTLEVGTAASRALVNIGLNSQSLGAATGLLDAREGNVNIFASDFNLGYAINNTGAATGTLRWDSPHTLDATNLYVSRGMGSGSLELAPGATFIARTSFFGLAYNDSGASAGTTLASLDLRLNNPNFSTFVGSDLSIGQKAFLGGASFASNASGSLVLGSNSTLEVGTAASRALVNIGLNSQSLGAATGLLDAREGNVNIFASDFNLGYAINNTGAATGTLRWDSPHTLDATNLYVSRGMGSGSLELAPGATFIARTSFFGLAYNDSGASAGTTLASLDLRLNNPNFSTFVGSDLSIGRKAFLGGASFASNASGSLVLGSNSTLEVGTAASRALVNIGLNSQSLGAATGLLDAREGNVNIFASDFNLGYAINNAGAATGTFHTGAQTAIDTTVLHLGRGPGAAGTLHLSAGVVTAATTVVGPGGEFDFTGGRFNAKVFDDALNVLDQKGGTLAPGPSASFLTITAQGYGLASAGVLEIDLLGADPGSQYDRLVITGGVNLNSDAGLGGVLDLVLGFGPTLGTSFTIIANDAADAIVGRFRGLPEGGHMCEDFGALPYCFQISYFGGTGNDVVLTAVPEPQTWMLMLAGAASVLFVARRRTRPSAASRLATN